jgi:hypothetical protein
MGMWEEMGPQFLDPLGMTPSSVLVPVGDEETAEALPPEATISSDVPEGRGQE